MPESDRWKAHERDSLLLELATLRDSLVKDGNPGAATRLEHAVFAVCRVSLDNEVMAITQRSANASCK